MCDCAGFYSKVEAAGIVEGFTVPTLARDCRRDERTIRAALSCSKSGHGQGARRRGELSERGSYGFALERHGQPRRRVLESFPISPVMGKGWRAAITPSATPRRLVNASLSPNTRRA